MDSSGNLYVADRLNHRIRKITPAGAVSTIAGNGNQGFVEIRDRGSGAALHAEFDNPTGVGLSSNGEFYVVDRNSHHIRWMETDRSYASVHVGSRRQGFLDGSLYAAHFNNPFGVAVVGSADNAHLFVADAGNNRIRKITGNHQVSTLAGNGTTALFDNPQGVAVVGSGINAYLYVTDTGNNRIREITSAGVVSTFAGTGNPGFADGTGTTEAQFYNPSGIAADSAGNLYVADNDNHSIRKISSDRGVTTIAGTGKAGFANSAGTETEFNRPFGVAVDSTGNFYVADTSNHCIRKITSTGVVTTFAGTSQGFTDGTGTAARFDNPSGIAVDSADNLYVADNGNHSIRKIKISTKVVSTLAGTGTAGSADTAAAQGDKPAVVAQFDNPSGIAVDSAGILYVADYNNNRIRKITSGGVVTTIAGDDTAAQFDNPSGIAVDLAGNLYVADYNNNRIQKIEYK